jgi:hypothetical protein
MFNIFGAVPMIFPVRARSVFLYGAQVDPFTAVNEKNVSAFRHVFLHYRAVFLFAMLTGELTNEEIVRQGGRHLCYTEVVSTRRDRPIEGPEVSCERQIG